MPEHTHVKRKHTLMAAACGGCHQSMENAFIDKIVVFKVLINISKKKIKKIDIKNALKSTLK